ncbi:DUF6745 domain-containing protein [Mycobacterium sp.]|uniref:DUF6745 domain-containing protein n=1 Tax=Mycobacterium sp. TaxID=1785 RepID=UPI00261758C9|nr:hypothetical protein [Mycobacterium sp.]
MANVLETLTPEQEALLDKTADAYIADLTVPREPDMVAINRWLDVVYSLFDAKRPERVEIAASPEAALKLASELTGEKQTQMDWCGVGDGGWASFYDVFHQIGVLTDEEAAEVLALRDFGKVTWDSVLLDECAIVIRRPVAIRLDDDGDLHSTSGPCLEWADGTRDFAYHGTWVPERIVMEPKSFTRDEILAITNTEHRRALGEIAGWQWFADRLGAEAVDKWYDRSTKLKYELLKCPDGAQLLRKQSPSLKSGKQPVYIEPVHEDLKTARAARKWQATRLTPAQCEADPALRYAVEA